MDPYTGMGALIEVILESCTVVWYLVGLVVAIAKSS